MPTDTLPIEVAPEPFRSPERPKHGLHNRLIAAILAPMILWGCWERGVIRKGVVALARVVVWAQCPSVSRKIEASLLF